MTSSRVRFPVRDAGPGAPPVDFESRLAGFYLDRAGLRPSTAGPVDLAE